jgi:hypothetical protein
MGRNTVESADLVDRRDRALGRLAGQLRERADVWTIRHHEDPYFFASAWDWNERGGRIHVSPQVWGASVTTAPGIDHVWLFDQPSEAYQKYRDGIDYLRANTSPPFARSESAEVRP